MTERDDSASGDMRNRAPSTQGQTSEATGKSTSALTAKSGTSDIDAGAQRILDQEALRDEVKALVQRLARLPTTEWDPQKGKVSTHVSRGEMPAEGIEYEVIDWLLVRYRILGRLGVPMRDWIVGGPGKFLRHLLVDAQHFVELERMNKKKRVADKGRQR